MLGSIKYNLRNLANFNGRDARQTFWYYVLFVWILRFVAGLAITIPMMVGMFQQIFADIDHPVTPEQMQGKMTAQMAGMIEGMAPWLLAIGVITAVLMLAALVRRIHDSDHSGWWALVPAVIFAAALFRMPVQLHANSELMRQQIGGHINQIEMYRQQWPTMLLEWLPLLIGAGFGILKSTPGPNRFGDSPVSF